MTSPNRSHRPPPYFEWFYFHFVTPEGVALNMVLHETDIFGLHQAPYLSLCVKFPGQASEYLRHDLGGSPICRGQSFLQAGQGMIYEDVQTTAWNISFPGRGCFRGQINKLSPPLTIQDGILYQEPGTGRTSHWVVQVPHATFTGILQLDGVTHRLYGTAYQDHQWGTLLLQEFVSDWVWGHFSNVETAVVFFQILTQSGQFIERVALVTAEGRFAGIAVDVSHLPPLWTAIQPEQFQGDATVSFLRHQLQLEFPLSPRQLMRSRLQEEHDGRTISYLRWGTTARLAKLEGKGKLQGVAEYLRIHPLLERAPTTTAAVVGL